MKKLFITLLALMMLLMSACAGNSKTVNTREEAQQMVEEFFDGLLEADPIKVDTYQNDTLVSTFMKDGDKMYQYYEDAGYGYYLFIKDDVKYLISDDLTLMEDEFMYDMSNRSLEFMLMMNVTGYFDVDDGSLTFKATNKADKELLLEISGESDDTQVNINTTAKKENNQISEMTTEMIAGEQTVSTTYKFEYNTHITLPEYKVPITYDNMPHVDSPYATFGQVINELDEDEDLFYALMENQLVVIDEVDNRHYQYSTVLDDETFEKYNNLDFMADDYNQQVYSLISELPIEDCIDFTDSLISPDSLKAYVGKTIQALIDDGFEINGYSFYEDDAYVFVTKDLMTYKVDAIIVDDFDPEADFESEDLVVLGIADMEFDSVEYAALPMK